MNVSVIIPCYNAGPYIRAALGSVAGQTRPPLETIVIDDGSTDHSLDEVRASGLPVRLLRSGARNAAVARNVGIEAAQGDWIAFLDADDIWLPTHLENAAELLSDGDVAYMANHEFLHANGATTPIPPSLQIKMPGSHRGLTHLRYAELMSQGLHFGHSTVLLRRDRVRAVGGFDAAQQRRHDMDLWLRVIQDQTWAWHDTPAAYYRVDTPGSISKSTVNAEYFFLRALLKNLPGFPTPAMRQVVETAARRSMSLAFVDGQQADFDAARSIAWPYLKPSFRLCYRAAMIWPSALRSAIRLKRRIVMTPRAEVE